MLNRDDFRSWLERHSSELVKDLEEWLPTELGAKDRSRLLAQLVPETLQAIDGALTDLQQTAT